MNKLALPFLIFSTVTLARADRASSILGCTHNLKSIATGLEMWATDHNGHYPKELKELVPKYIEHVPPCPAAGTDTYSSSYREAGSEGFSMYCAGHHHKDFGLRRNEPGLDARHYLGPQSMLARLHKLEDRSNGQKPVQRCSQNLKNIATALEMWSTDHAGRYPKELADLKQGNYLRDIPRCLDRDPYSYQTGAHPDWFLLHCHGSNHKRDGSPANFPQYHSNKGLRRE
ncbi:hypothetical protein JST97_18575 [bacterium]|nr:hypothetical protein [bacterium]